MKRIIFIMFLIGNVFAGIAQTYYRVDKAATNTTRNNKTINWEAGYIIEVRDTIIYWGNDTIDYKQKRTSEIKVDSSFVSKKSDILFIINYIDSTLIIHNKLGKLNPLFDKNKDTIQCGYSKMAKDSLIHLFYNDSVTFKKNNGTAERKLGIVPLFFNFKSLPVEFEIKRGNDSLATAKRENNDTIYYYGGKALDYCCKDTLLLQCSLDSTLLYLKSGNDYLIFDKSSIKIEEQQSYLPTIIALGVFALLLVSLCIFCKDQKNNITSVCKYSRKEDNCAVFEITINPDEISNLQKELGIQDEQRIKKIGENNVEVFLELESKMWEKRTNLDKFIKNRCDKDTFYKINNLTKQKQLKKNQQYKLPVSGQVNILKQYSKKCTESLLNGKDKINNWGKPTEETEIILNTNIVNLQNSLSKLFKTAFVQFENGIITDLRSTITGQAGTITTKENEINALKNSIESEKKKIKEEKDKEIEKQKEEHKKNIEKKEAEIIDLKNSIESEKKKIKEEKDKEIEKQKEEHKKNIEKKEAEITNIKSERDKIANEKDEHYKKELSKKDEIITQEKNEKERKVKEITESKDKELAKEKQARIDAVNAEIVKSERYHENVIFADELKPYAEKTLALMDMANTLQKECAQLYKREKDNTKNNRLLDKAFAKFQSATYNLNAGDWHEQLNSIANNGTLIIPPKGKENSYSSCYAAIRHIVAGETGKRAEEFQKTISITLLNRYCSALLVLIEDVMLLAEYGVSLPEKIKELRNAIRVHLTKELGLAINDIKLLDSSQNNSGIQVVDKIPTTLKIPENSVIEVLSYGIERKGTSIDPTKVIASK